MTCHFTQHLTTLLRGAWTKTEAADRRRRGIVPAELIEQTRMQWADDFRVRFDVEPQAHIGEDGIWIGAWILAGKIAAITPTARAEALARLPVMAREVYSLHKDSGLGFEEIGSRLGVRSDKVGTLLAQALIALDAIFDAD